MTMDELNAAIAALPGDKITREQMEERIANEHYTVLPDTTLTICALVLDNGFVSIGTSACVDPANYRKEIGEKLAYEDAFKKLWPLFGFLLSEALFQQSKTS